MSVPNYIEDWHEYFSQNGELVPISVVAQRLRDEGEQISHWVRKIDGWHRDDAYAKRYPHLTFANVYAQFLETEVLPAPSPIPPLNNGDQRPETSSGASDAPRVQATVQKGKDVLLAIFKSECGIV